MSRPDLIRIVEVRRAFWRENPELWRHYRAGRRQNAYPADVRVAFVEWVDALERAGRITEGLASRVTL